MLRLPKWSAAVLALGILAIVAPGRALAADERTDLSIELRPFSPTKPRQVVLRVANTTAWWANTAKLTVTTSQAKQGTLSRSHFDDFDPGWTGEVTYTLAADCKPGDTITARLSIAVNYNNVEESNPGNNTIEAQACPAKAEPAAKPQAQAQAQPKPSAAPKPQADPKPQPDPKPQADPKPLPDLKPDSVLGPEDLPIPALEPAMGDPVDPGMATTTRGRPASAASVPRPVPGNPVDPGTAALKPATVPSGRSAGEQALEGVISVHTRPGKHELDFEPSEFRRLSRNGSEQGPFTRHLSDSRDPKVMDPKVMKVGWDHLAGFRVHQTAVNFDLAALLKIEGVRIEEAHLGVIERPIVWGPDVGNRPDQPGCVAEVGLATNNWTVPLQQFVSGDLLFRDRHLTFKTVPHQLSTNEIRSRLRWRGFDVTDHVRNQVAHPDDLKLWLGYVLHGAVEDDRHPPPDGGCSSELYGVRLWITYVVPAN